MTETTADTLGEVFRDQWGSVLATLIRVLGSFDLAEEVAQEAFKAALEQWPTQGKPENARAWLVQVARHKAVSILRRRARFDLVEDLEALWVTGPDPEAGMPTFDDRLRLIFTCCHPALAPEARIALTLRTLCGLRTEEIARAFLVPVPTIAQRLVRAKSKIRDAGIPYAVPEARELGSRLESVMGVLYALFNEGYTATAGDQLCRDDLCHEAIRLVTLLRELMKARADTSEVAGLQALMLLHDSRRTARTSADGDLVLLEDQDRASWDHRAIAIALPLVEEALRGTPGPYGVQAAIAALHARAARAQDTDWRQIAVLYGVLETMEPSPLVSLNRAAAVAMAEGPAAGLALVDRVAERGTLDDYHLLHAARADLLRRLDRNVESAAAYRLALQLTQNEAERRFLERRLHLVTHL